MTEMRTYEITFTDRGPIRITIPETWKVTFGAVVPGAKGGYSGTFGLRIWEATDKQRAVFANVASFRDLSIEIMVAAVRKYGTEEWFADDGRTWTGAMADLVEKGWKPESEVTPGDPPMGEPLVGSELDPISSYPMPAAKTAWIPMTAARKYP
jgi:hypothetical protein